MDSATRMEGLGLSHICPWKRCHNLIQLVEEGKIKKNHPIEACLKVSGVPIDTTVGSHIAPAHAVPFST